MLRVRLWRWISATARSNRTSATWASGANFPFVELTYTRSKSAGLARPLRARRTTTGRESPSPSRRATGLEARQSKAHRAVDLEHRDAEQPRLGAVDRHAQVGAGHAH